MKLIRGSSIGEFDLSDRRVRVGMLEFARGERIPVSGVSCHSEDEVSFILSGTLKGMSGGLPFTVSAGETTYIPAGEEHWAIVLEDAKIAFVLIPVGVGVERGLVGQAGKGSNPA